jgi:hypothetical protein
LAEGQFLDTLTAGLIDWATVGAKINYPLSADNMPSPSSSSVPGDALGPFVELSRCLRTGLDDDAVRLCARLLLEDPGVNPEALAILVMDLEREFGHHRYLRASSHTN